MRGTLGLYKKSNGTEEVRMHFLRWELPDGRELSNVTIFPHPCHTCAGGDHTHVEMDDDRKPEKILLREAIEIAPKHKAVIDEYLAQKLMVNELTLELNKYIGLYAGIHAHGH